MPKTKISEWSSTPANNTDIDSINIAEGCAPSGINDAIRELMAQVKDLYSGTSGDAIGVAGGGTGQTSYTNGQLLIGNTTGNTLTKATLTAGTGISITNSTGSITIANTAPASSATPTVEGTVYGKMTSGGGTPFLTALGYNAAPAMTTGTRTVAVGREALLLNTSGDRNHAFGMGALASNLTGSYNTAVGYTALNASTADNNTAVGYQAGLSTTGTTNSFFGDRAGQNLTTGTNNTGIGAYTINGASGSGTYNVAVGQGAMNGNTSGSSNVSIGSQALQANTTASEKTAVGYQAGYNSTGSSVTLVGAYAGYSTTTGVNNTLIGHGSGYYMTTGAKNTVLGRFDGNQGGLDIRTASNFIVLSDGDGNPRGYYNNNAGGSSGYNWQFNNGGASASTVVNITNSNASTPYGIYTLFSGAAPNNTTNYFLSCNDNATSCFTIWSNGTTSGRSDSRLKKNIADATPKLNDLCRLQVRNYEWETSIGGSKEIGLIAQEVEQVFPNLVVTHDIEKDGDDYKEVKYSVFVPMLIKAIQELKAEFDAYKASHP